MDTKSWYRTELVWSDGKAREVLVALSPEEAAEAGLSDPVPEIELQTRLDTLVGSVILGHVSMEQPEEAPKVAPEGGHEREYDLTAEISR